MRFQGSNIPIPTGTQPQVVSISGFLGLNVSTTSTEIGDKESPELLNVTVDPNGSIEKRKGYKKVFNTSLGAGKINGLFHYNKINGTEMILFAHGTKLYKIVNNLPVEITTPHGMSNNKCSSYVMNDKLYIQDSVHLYQYDGTSVIDVESIAYVPTVSVSRAPNGTQTNFNEPFNVLQPGFKDSFSGNTTDTIYFLSQDHLDATPVTVDRNNTIYNEGVSFTVDRVAGTINFAGGTAPLGIPGAGTNNVITKAYKSHTDIAEQVKKCTFNILYGGANDTKVFIGGNKDEINVVRYSESYDPTYWPDTNYIAVGSNNEPVKGFTIQYDTLIVHKEHSKWNLSYGTDNLGIAMFPLKPINDSIGCIAEDSIALVNNSPIALDSAGVYILKGGSVRDERNVESVSVNVDNLLLKEPNLDKALAVDYKNKYILVVNNNAYVFDYIQNVWFKWNNIKASNFLIFKDELYFGSNEAGLIYKFYSTNDKTSLYNDDGQPIRCYWKTKVLSLGSNSRVKTIDRVLFSMLPGSPSSVDVSYRSDIVPLQPIDTARRKLMSYSTLNYADFSYKATIYPDLIPIKLKAKKVVYIQFIFENNRLDDSMTITNIDIKYSIGAFKK